MQWVCGSRATQGRDADGRGHPGVIEGLTICARDCDVPRTAVETPGIDFGADADSSTHTPGLTWAACDAALGIVREMTNTFVNVPINCRAMVLPLVSSPLEVNGVRWQYVPAKPPFMYGLVIDVGIGLRQECHEARADSDLFRRPERVVRAAGTP